MAKESITKRIFGGEPHRGDECHTEEFSVLPGAPTVVQMVGAPEGLVSSGTSMGMLPVVATLLRRVSDTKRTTDGAIHIDHNEYGCVSLGGCDVSLHSGQTLLMIVTPGTYRLDLSVNGADGMGVSVWIESITDAPHLMRSGLFTV